MKRLALLSLPSGGLYLDVKSAYSKPRDLEMFVAALAGVGVGVKVCVCDRVGVGVGVGVGLAIVCAMFVAGWV